MKTLFLNPIIVLLTFILSTQALLAEDLIIIINDQNSIVELTPDQISGYFLKRNRQWPDGTPVRFFDRKDDSEERKIFLNDFVKKTPREIELYWIGQKLYTGNSAPIQIPSDSLTASMVSRFKGAIGIVSSRFEPPKGVKKVVIKRDAK
jgi:hypothetical protein